MRAYPDCLLAPLSACLLLAAAPAQAGDRVSFLPVGAVADAPAGFIDMCERVADACKADGDGDVALPDAAAMPGTAKAHRAEWSMIAALNRAVNRRIVQRSDEDVHGAVDRWTRAVDAGDCEDIALEKQAELIGAGLDPRRLRLAIVYDRWVGLHAVLIVTTARGDMVLDNRISHLVRWDRAGYRWLRVQSAANGRTWNVIA